MPASDITHVTHLATVGEDTAKNVFREISNCLVPKGLISSVDSLYALMRQSTHSFRRPGNEPT